jgi:calcineurin-like phosphoesterase
MTGPRDGVIGMDREAVLERFLTQLPTRFEVAKGPAQLSAVAIDVDEATGRARSIDRIHEVEASDAD